MENKIHVPVTTNQIKMALKKKKHGQKSPLSLGEDEGFMKRTMVGLWWADLPAAPRSPSGQGETPRSSSGASRLSLGQVFMGPS